MKITSIICLCLSAICLSVSLTKLLTSHNSIHLTGVIIGCTGIGYILYLMDTNNE